MSNPFTAHKRLTALAVTLLAFGIDLEATDDVGAALQSKLDAAGAASKDQIAAAVAKATEAEREALKATMEVLTEKANLLDLLDKQAAAEGIDLRAMAKDGAIAAAIDSKSREIAREVLGSNAPPKVGIDPGPDATPTGLQGSEHARKYATLLGQGKTAEADEYFAAHSSDILAFADIQVTPEA